MRVQFASDLHLEFRPNREYLKANPLIPTGDILLLAGDIMPISRIDRYSEFLSFCSDHFQSTYWVPGNHEYYTGNILGTVGSFSENVRSNVHLVNNYSITIGGVQFVLSTLWTPISASNATIIGNAINDYKLIKDGEDVLTPERSSELFEENFSFIKRAVETSSAENCIVVTHHVPTFDHYPEQYRHSRLNQAFVVDLNEFITDSPINRWIFGHHHSNVEDFFIGKTRMMTNQLGYIELNEQEGFGRRRVFEV